MLEVPGKTIISISDRKPRRMFEGSRTHKPEGEENVSAGVITVLDVGIHTLYTEDVSEPQVLTGFTIRISEPSA